MTTAIELRERALDMFEQRHDDWLIRSRRIAIEVAQDFGSVSINDIRPRCPLPADASPALYGAVFRTRELKADGWTNATHPASHGRIVRVYRYRGA